MTSAALISLTPGLRSPRRPPPRRRGTGRLDGGLDGLAVGGRRLVDRLRSGFLAGRGELRLGDLCGRGRDAVGDRADHERARADRVVVARHDIRRLVGVAVRVDERDDRQAETLRLTDGELLLAEVDDEHRVRLALHRGHAAEVRLELLELAAHRDALLRREQIELSLLLQAPELLEVRDAVGDRAPVRQQAAEPAVSDERLPDAGRLADDRVLGLLLRADEEDRAPTLGDVPREIVRLLQQRLRLLEVDDVDAAALVEDEALHLRVPAARLVAEVHPGLQQLLHGDDCHDRSFRLVCRCAGGRGRNRARAPSTPVRRRRRVGGLELRNGSRQASFRARARASERSGGSGDSSATCAPVNGCSNESRSAWRNCRSSPRSRATP